MKTFTYTYWLNNVRETLTISQKTGLKANERFRLILNDQYSDVKHMLHDWIYIQNHQTGSLSRAKTRQWLSLAK